MIIVTVKSHIFGHCNNAHRITLVLSLLEFKMVLRDRQKRTETNTVKSLKLGHALKLGSLNLRTVPKLIESL